MFDKTKALIGHLEKQKAILAPRLVNAYEKAASEIKKAERKIESLQKRVSEKRGRKKGDIRSALTFFLINGKPGDVFITDKTDRNVTGIASAHSIKVKTRRLICLHPFEMDTQQVTEVTILEKPKP